MSPAHRTKMFLIAVFFMGVLLLLASCSQSEPEGTRAAPPQNDKRATSVSEVDEHGLHVLKSSRLQEIMRRLSAMDFDAVSREIETVGAVNRDICEVSKMAEELSLDALVIPIIFKRDHLQDEPGRVLDTMSHRLYEQAVELRHYADANNVNMVKVKIDEMIATCISCHASFRAPALATAGDTFPDMLLGDVR